MISSAGTEGRRHRGLFRAGEAEGPTEAPTSSFPTARTAFEASTWGRIVDGQSIQPVTVESGARYATPLVLRADGDRRCGPAGSRAARGPHDLLSSGHARRRRPLLDLFAQPGAQPGRVPRRVADRAGRRHGAAVRNAARSEGRERHRHRAARSRSRHVQPAAVRAQLRLRPRDGQEQPLLRARQSTGALPLLSAGTARRGMAGVDAGTGGHRSGDDREVRPEADRHATGQYQHVAESTAC